VHLLILAGAVGSRSGLVVGGIALISVGLTVGIGLAWLPTMVDLEQEAAGTDPAAEGWWYEGLHVGILAVMVLGVLMASTEYGTGTIRATLTAVPARPRVLAAKAVTIAAVTLVAGAVQAVATFLSARPILASYGYPVPLGDPVAWRGVGLATLAMSFAGLFGLGFGLLIRHSAGAIGAVVAVVFVVGLLGTVLSADLARYLPANSLYAMFTPSGGATLAAGPGAAVFTGYLVALLVPATILFHRRDA
jgi:ABC-2 type transport system permease protein